MRRGLTGALLLLPGLVLLWLAAGFLGALLPGPHARFDGPAEVEIGLIATPLHFDLLLPLDAPLRARFAFARAAGVAIDAPGGGWLLVGWGARDFYTQAGSYADISAPAVLKAITGDVSVLRLEVWGATPLAQIPGARALRLTRAGYAALIDRILAERAPGPGFAGLTGADAFFPAQTGFSAAYTCNAWVGDSLRAAGVPAGRWTPTPQALRLALWLHG